MTLNAQAVFLIELGRSGYQSAHKFLRARALQRADREDVIGAATLWCWENQANYSLTTTLETWFMNAVRDAYKKLLVNELPTCGESIEKMGGGDYTYETAAADSSTNVLLNALTPTDKEIARMTMEGRTYREINKRGYANDAINDAQKRIKQLRKLLPDTAVRKALSRTEPAGNSDDASDRLSKIDMELARLDFAPHAGKDCPPCWRCMWFEGFMPSGKLETRLKIEDAEVREAVRNTEARKIEIAQKVRDGIL
jgi:hypothetical protein